MCGVAVINLLKKIQKWKKNDKKIEKRIEKIPPEDIIR
jgi:hypothetical protein